ncbi:MAG: DNA-formamidopyrimidine glycosylase family protein [Planctomycetota bacterium]
MPEGDTIHKIANAIAPLLEGRRLERFELGADRTLDLAGRRVDRVEARGKHLLVTVEGDLILRTHLGMNGSWHRYAVREPWKRPARQASLVLGTGADVFVCFNAKESECLRARTGRAADFDRRLGPDLVADEEPDLEALAGRARRLLAADAPLADVLLHQGVACGIGNVYKSEVLFLHRLHPRRRLDSVDDGTLREVYATARRLLRQNLGGGARVTRPAGDGAGDLWAYGRAGRGCFRCERPIASEVLGSGRRVTYWCPGCQAG